MDEHALVEALAICFEQKEDEKLARFIGQVASQFQSESDALNELVGIGAYAVAYYNDAIFIKVVDALYDCYASIDESKADRSARHLKVAVACYELGAQLVRLKRWDLIAPFAQHGSLRRIRTRFTPPG